MICALFPPFFQWEWSLFDYGYSSELTLYQTDSTYTALEGGFVSQTTAGGSFSFTFVQAGVYYFLGCVLQDCAVRMEGNVTVAKLESASYANITVKVSGYPAAFNEGEGVASSEMTGTDLLECESSDIPLGVFQYSVNSTPVIESVQPRDVNLDDTILIAGTGLSNGSFAFGFHACAAVNVSEELVACELMGSPDSYVPLPLDEPVMVGYAGYAFVAIQDAAEKSVTVLPHIESIFPTYGSLYGRTTLEITGVAFPSTNLTVLVGSQECEITSITYSKISCLTPAYSGSNLTEPITADVVVTHSGHSSAVACRTPDGQCQFGYAVNESSPVVDNVELLRVNGEDTFIISGMRFSENVELLSVSLDGYDCSIVSLNSTSISCVPTSTLSAGTYKLLVHIALAENSEVSLGTSHPYDVDVPLIVSTFMPTTGSLLGGTTLSISGSGFPNYASALEVLINSELCVVIEAQSNHIVCTTPANEAESLPIRVGIVGTSIETYTQDQFEYTLDSTPTITQFSPTMGQVGDTLNIIGSGFSDALNVTVSIGGEKCNVTFGNETTIQCEILGQAFAGYYDLRVLVHGKGLAAATDGLQQFYFTPSVGDVSPTEGSFAGRNTLSISVSGYNPASTLVRVCDVLCEPTGDVPNLNELSCIVPAYPLPNDGSQSVACDIALHSDNGNVNVLDTTYTYMVSLTPIVTGLNRTRGGTGGGSVIEITGMGLADAEPEVTIAGVNCNVTSWSDDKIVCQTGPSPSTVRAQVIVNVPGKGYAISDGVEFFYVDLWSSNFTWGGGPLPEAGDFIVIKRGQTVYLDTVTPVLSIVLILGGSLVFDEEQENVELHSEHILVTGGGTFQVGTESDPYTSRAQIVLYGHVLSTEIPLYGAKTLAVREGTLDLHGRPLSVTWTKLSNTTDAGDLEIHLQECVTGDWEVGGKVVIAATGFSQRENEEREIAAIDDTGTVITLTEPLEYEHISVQQMIAGRFVDMSAEVGYLTRNVVVRGNLNEEWVEEVPACPEEFRTGQFELQTCFQGRFGAETVNDQFGSQIMIHAAKQDEGLVTGRIEYIEVTHAGQAFRLGRYPIHFHLNGDVSGSYVRGNAIHHTFNRAVTIHAVNYLLVEKNVAFNVLGHAYFLEDGIEVGNVIQDNLGIFVRASSSLLNVDITPATFWIVNPNNTVRRNAAAGGTHFGYWYRLDEHPTGPSATDSVCPRNIPVAQFANNTAHSFGWYGLWVFPSYHPKAGGGCNSQESEPAIFENLLAWRNDRGAEFTDIEALQLTNSIMVDNKLAGVEVITVGGGWEEEGVIIKDTIIAGHSDLSSSDFCTKSGVKTPHTYFLTVTDVTFVNFDRPGCFAIQACAHCKPLQGGFETRYSGITFQDSPKIARWQWAHEHVHRDMDGSLTGVVGGALVPTTGILPPDSCESHPSSSEGGVPGSLCNSAVEFGRAGFVNPTPSLNFADMIFSNQYGNTTVEYQQKRLVTGQGYTALLPLQELYYIQWESDFSVTNISYSAVMSGFQSDDYIFLCHRFTQELDFTEIAGIEEASPLNETILDHPELASTGDWFASDNVTLHYIVKGINDRIPNVGFSFQTYKCFYENCIPPPPPPLATPPPPIPEGRPNVTVSWSDPSMWPSGVLPQEGDDVYINCSLYVLADVALPRLGKVTLCGGLELSNGMDHVLETDLILIEGTGTLAVGYPDIPYTGKARIVLHGDSKTPEFRFKRDLPQGPNVGAKALAVFGNLFLHSEYQREPSWTRLETTAMPGDTTLHLESSVNWLEEDEIVVTSTSFDGEEAEVFTILSISDDGTMLTLNGSVSHKHIGEESSFESRSYSIRAEVAVLTRNIKIESGDPETADEEGFGCRILVGVYQDEKGDVYSGSAQIDSVEFKQCGQLGHVQSFDPRFALSFLDVGKINDESSYVTKCSFHDGYNTAIGVFGTDGLKIDSNVVYITVGASIHVTGNGHVVTKNLAAQSLFPGTYRGMFQEDNFDWTANFEAIDTQDLVMNENVAAGGSRAGFHVNGEKCQIQNVEGVVKREEPSEPRFVQFEDNVAHSTLHGVHLGYSDGNKDTECSFFKRLTAYSCFHYGLFSYTSSSVWITDSTFINNRAAIFVDVIGPASLSHVASEKAVLIEDSLIAATSIGYDCDDDTKIPAIASHPLSNRAIDSRSGGRVGIVISSFVSGNGHFPPAPWFSIISYPAITGLTSIEGVSFVDFIEHCDGMKDVALMANPQSEDANHPVHLSGISLQNIEEDRKFFNREPILGSVNPSDCVDLDCDGFKHIVVVDKDGSFTSRQGLSTIISKAEFEWDGDPHRGLGDYRIPKTMLSYPNGSRKAVNDTFPKKGIVRGTSFGDESDCEFNDVWNAYHCSNLDHLMVVLESLDPDTEVRRLSPIGVAANGFIDILNGPQDNGWCGGYTCQERISTFFGVVAAGQHYSIGLTSTNPQRMAVRLLNAAESQSIAAGIIYTTPQRLDVYYKGVYVRPTNADPSSEDLKYVLTDDIEEFIPTVDDEAGTNFYDRDLKQLFIVVRGSQPVEIRTTPVIQVALDLFVSTDDFFNEDMIVSNIAFLLNIPPDKIRIVDIVSESAKKRKRQTEGGQQLQVNFEIGEEPVAELTSPTPAPTMPPTSENDTTVNATMPPTNETEGGSTTLDIQELTALTSAVVELIQTGTLAESLNVTIMGAQVEEPIPPPDDPPPRATNTTGGPQPDEVNSTMVLTYSEMQMLLEEQEENETTTVVLSIPSYLSITQQPHGGGGDGGVVESVPLSLPFAVALYDTNDNLVTFVLSEPWTLTASIVEVVPKSDAFLINPSVNFSREGVAVFHDLAFSHPGAYTLRFDVTHPPSATKFSVSTNTVLNVVMRQLNLEIVTQPSDGGNVLPIDPPPAVWLVDALTGAVVTNDWREREWTIHATAAPNYPSSIPDSTNVMWSAPLTNGEAVFHQILISSPGTYNLVFSADTAPESSSNELPELVVSDDFVIEERQFTRYVITYMNNYTIVVGNNKMEFIEMFRMTIRSSFPDVSVYNVTVMEGSIIVSFFVTADTLEPLLAFVNQLNESGVDLLSFEFNGYYLMPSSIEQDEDYPISIPPEPTSNNNLLIILIIAVPGSAVLLAVILLILVSMWCRNRKKKRKVFHLNKKPSRKISSLKPSASSKSSEVSTARYISHGDLHVYPSESHQTDLPGYSSETTSFIKKNRLVEDVEDEEEDKELSVVVKEEIKPRGAWYFSNPAAELGEVKDVEECIKL